MPREGSVTARIIEEFDCMVPTSVYIKDVLLQKGVVVSLAAINKALNRWRPGWRDNK